MFIIPCAYVVIVNNTLEYDSSDCLRLCVRLNVSEDTKPKHKKKDIKIIEFD